MNDDILMKMLEVNGDFIKEIKKPSTKLCLIAIKNKPSCIQYIKEKRALTDEMRILAISLDKSTLKLLDKRTPKVCDFLGIFNAEEKNIKKEVLYPHDYYFVKLIVKNCLDEADVGCMKIVKGSDMEYFMNQTFSAGLSSNNMDSREFYVKDFVKFHPITNDECKTLQKLDLTDSMFGCICFYDYVYNSEQENF